MTQTPILFLSDSPDLHTGLARITRDILRVAQTIPELRCGIIGMGGHGTRLIGCPTYNFPKERAWGQHDFPAAWQDFAGDAPGILFSIWDVTRLEWIVDPEAYQMPDRILSNVSTWIYCPVDGAAPGERLSAQPAAALRGFDRVLAYTQYGQRVLSNTLGRPVDWIPHGINCDVFRPRDKAASRMAMQFPQGATVIGTVATNQMRKDWGVAAQTMALLKQQIKNLRWWIHIDVLERHWNIPALLVDFGLTDIAKVTVGPVYNDTELSYAYSACDATFLPSVEGFGYPIVESQACGVPCVHGTEAGGAELTDYLVEPMADRVESVYNVVRPVWSPWAWSSAIQSVLEKKPQDCRERVIHLDWPSLKHVWRKWLKEGIA